MNLLIHILCFLCKQDTVQALIHKVGGNLGSIGLCLVGKVDRV